jgi:hypothetical protein
VTNASSLHHNRLAGRLAVAVAVTLTLALTALCSPAQALPGDTLGVYAGAGAPQRVATFEGQLGREVSLVHDTFSKESWTALTDVGWWLSTWGSTKYAQRVVYTVPMLPNSGGTLADGAAGAYNAHFRLMAQRLVAGGRGNATLRLGPEFNGNWFKWTIAVPNGGAHFAAYWRQIVTTMRSVPGANFTFDWCPNAGSSYVNGQPLKAESAWPGNAYVDYVGADIYDQSWAAHRADASARWNEYLNAPNGLRWHRDFAAAHGKRMTFPEWGIAQRTDGYGGGDSPYFIERMYEWIRTNNVAFHMYFEYADSVADYAIFGGRTPNAARRFVELFGAGAKATSLAAPTVAAAATTTAKSKAAKKKAAKKKRCVTRAVKKKNGKALRRNGKVVRKTTCVKIQRVGKRASSTKVKQTAARAKPSTKRT